jgi:hypothetical protein
MPSDLEARTRERVLQKYGPELLKQLSPWERKLLILMEEVKIEDEEEKPRAEK